MNAITPLFSLDGKNALITGAGGGIGRAVAERFVAAGARVIITDIVDGRTTAGEIGADFLRMDVGDEQDVADGLSQARDSLGRLDIVVNNAGIGDVGSAIADTPAEVLERITRINQWGVFHGLKHAPPHMNDGGSIINTSSLAAIVAFEHNINYVGSGFQMKMYGKVLNLLSMMIAISDEYDKLRNKPEYYQEGGPEKAYEEMMELAGTRFHPDLLNNFFSIMGVFPPGVLVELTTKEVGLVIQPSVLDIRRPQVEILYDDEGNKYDEPYIVNLMEKDKNGVFKRSIVKTISPFKFQIPSKYTV